MMTEGFSSARHIEHLDPDALPTDCKLNVLVDLVHDSLGRPLQVPVIVARGRRPGPVLGLTAAIHGNELNGIPVIHRLMDQIDCKTLRGTVVAVVAVNVPGLLLSQRAFDDGSDLNHLFPGRPNGNSSQVYAYRIIERIVSRFDRLIDLHTASFGRANSLYVRANLRDDAASTMAFAIRPEIIVHNPPSDRTLRGTAAELGIPAITVEIGDPQRFQPHYIRSTLVGVRQCMADMGMLPKRTVAPGPEPVVCSRSSWLYTDHGGLLDVFPQVTDAVQQGEVVAHLRDIFGGLVREYRAPEHGVVVGRSVNPIGQTGARILHLGIPAGTDDPLFAPRAARNDVGEGAGRDERGEE